MSKTIKSISNPKLHLEILSQADVKRIHEATLWIIEKVGVRFPSEAALEIWEANGAQVDRQTKAFYLAFGEYDAVVISDVARLFVETTDLSEQDVPGVAVGQPVRVHLKALNKDVKGKVARISPLADTLGGDVVYKTRIDLDSLPEGLRAGMLVFDAVYNPEITRLLADARAAERARQAGWTSARPRSPSVTA